MKELADAKADEPGAARLLALLDAQLDLAFEEFLTAGHDPADRFRGLYLQAADVRESRTAMSASRMDRRGLGLMDQRLELLASRAGLDDRALEILLLAAAADLDARYERIFAFVQDDVARRRPTVELALRLCAGGASEREARSWLTAGSPLVRFRLIRPVPGDGSLLSAALRVDERVIGYLLGSDEVEPRVAPCLRSLPRGVPLPPRLGAVIETQMDAAVESMAGAWPGLPAGTCLVSAHTPEDALATVALLAARTERSVLAVDLDQLLAQPSPVELVSLACREAMLSSAVLTWLNGGVLWRSDPPPDPGLQPVSAALRAALADWPIGQVVVVDDRLAPPILPNVDWVPVSVPGPDAADRLAAWRSTLERDATSISAASLASLAATYRLTPAQIAAAAELARAATRSAGEEALSAASLVSACRAVSSRHIADLAQEIVPRCTWADLVLPEDTAAQLRELCAMVRGRGRVLEEWGFGRRLSTGTATTALFAGPSGTGKTLAAQVVAHELDLPLFRIDLSGVVSKWIGETEKNLDRVFAAAEDSNAILFFDEADALFGKRSEVKDSHDRYANLEISYLLQKMETYDGVAILATNMRQQLDEAFVRRLSTIVIFPLPDEAQRRRIWQAVWPADLPRASDVDLDALARHKLVGGNIRNVVLAAAYLASASGGPVGRAHLDHALRREYQKLGRSERDG